MEEGTDDCDCTTITECKPTWADINGIGDQNGVKVGLDMLRHSPISKPPWRTEWGRGHGNSYFCESPLPATESDWSK